MACPLQLRCAHAMAQPMQIWKVLLPNLHEESPRRSSEDQCDECDWLQLPCVASDESRREVWHRLECTVGRVEGCSLACATTPVSACCIDYSQVDCAQSHKVWMTETWVGGGLWSAATAPHCAPEWGGGGLLHAQDVPTQSPAL